MAVSRAAQCSRRGRRPVCQQLADAGDRRGMNETKVMSTVNTVRIAQGLEPLAVIQVEGPQLGGLTFA